ncbi:MAG: chlorophyllase [Bradymonadia bacterium]|jgi:chlorophyllase
MTTRTLGLLGALLVGGLWACDDGGSGAPDTPDMNTEQLDQGRTGGQLDATVQDAGDARPSIDQALPDANAPDAVADLGQPDGAGLTDSGATDSGAIDDGVAADQGPPPALSPVYDPGPYAVERLRVAEGMSDAPRAMDVYQPVDAPAAPVIVWQHGFLLDVALYSDMLTHVASHGFVVVAPQMYAADNNPIGKPSAVDEAATAARVIAWVDSALVDVVAAAVDGEAPGVAGHSRGGKVIWLLMLEDATQARAIAGVDPVDGQGGPFGGEARALDSEIDFGGVPTLVLGTGLGGMPVNAFAPACAPVGDAHARFYERTSAPVWHGVATDHGHNDMLNDDGCGFLCSACVEGPDRASMRRYVAGQLVAHFSAALRGDAMARAVLEAPAAAPLPATAEDR